MATLVFSALGTALGGPLGGAIGALIGRQADSAIFGTGRSEGPRLKDLATTTSTYGAPLPRLFGRMRVAGTIIWATELAEHRSTHPAKNRPSTTTYSYTASFAVALSSRPIAGIGRIWADGNLLRGAAGDLKVAGALRIHTGMYDQSPDPLIAAAETIGRCPAHRGLAYVVFEDLDVSEFYNCIPTLTFEVLADDLPSGGGDLALGDIVDPLLDDVDATVALPGLRGLSCEGPLLDTLQLLDPYYPIACDAGGDRLIFGGERLHDEPLQLDEAAVSVRDDDFGGSAGFIRKRAPVPVAAPQVLRYYDVDRDYLTGSQRAAGRPGPGNPRTVELPAAMTATTARSLVERVARKSDWSRDTLLWRTAELDRDVAPGAIVIAPGQPGRWRVDEWEWRDTGVELSLTRVLPPGVAADAVSTRQVDGGRVGQIPDLLAMPTLLRAFELPSEGAGSRGANGDAPLIAAAVSSASAGWKGAALFLDRGDGNLSPLGPSGRTRATLGITRDTLPAADPLLFDRASVLVVDLADTGMVLSNADLRGLTAGANRALVGGEIIQFASAKPLGGGAWSLAGLLRGRGGTEGASATHTARETFVLLDDAVIALDAAAIGTGSATIVAEGLGDSTAVTSGIALRGLSRRPLSPVHGRVTMLAGSGCLIEWTRRSRGGWTWEDGVDVPLREEAEAYQVTFGDLDAPTAAWTVSQQVLALDGPTLNQLHGLLPGGALRVRQQGSFALSDPLLLGPLPPG